MDGSDSKHPALIKEVLKKSLVVENTTGNAERFTLFCRTPEKLGVMIEWLASRYPNQFPDAESLVSDLNSLHDRTNLDAIRADEYLGPIYERIKHRLDIMQVDLPEREGRTRAARKSTGCDPCPKETIFLFGIPLPKVSSNPSCSEIFEKLKEFKLAECNVARIGAYDPAEKIIVDRLMAQDNLRAKG